MNKLLKCLNGSICINNELHDVLTYVYLHAGSISYNKEENIKLSKSKINKTKQLMEKIYDIVNSAKTNKDVIPKSLLNLNGKIKMNNFSEICKTYINGNYFLFEIKGINFSETIYLKKEIVNKYYGELFYN